MLDILKDRGIQVSANLAKRYGEANVLFHNCDVTDKSELKVAYEKVIKQFGHLDIVCNNAGIGDELDWERTIDVNLVCCSNECSQTALLDITILLIVVLSK